MNPMIPTRIRRNIAVRILFTLVVATWLLSPATQLVARPKGVYFESGSPTLPAPKKIAIFLGINGFDDPFWPNLRWPENDAQALAANLKKQGGFDALVFLPAKQQPLMEFLQSLSSSRYHTLFFYISSHGTLFTNKRGMIEQTIVLQDSKHQQLSQTTLTHSRLKQWFNQLDIPHKVLILATCHSGLGKSKLTATMSKKITSFKGPTHLPIFDASEGSMIISVASLGETALEDDQLQHDVYTYFFMQAFKLGDLNDDGAVVVSEAHDYARRKTYTFTQGKQLPTAESKILGVDSFVLAGSFKKPAKPILISYTNRYKGFNLFVNGKNKGTLPLGIPIAKGIHTIELKHAEHLNEAPLLSMRTLIEGNITRVEDIFALPGFRLGLQYSLFSFNQAIKSQQFNFGLVPTYGLSGQLFWGDGLAFTVKANQTDKVVSHIDFFQKQFKAIYQSSAVSLGILMAFYRTLNIETAIYADIWRSFIDISLESDGDFRLFPSKYWEIGLGAQVSKSMLRTLALYLHYEMKISKVFMQHLNNQSFVQRMTGLGGGFSWQF